MADTDKWRKARDGSNPCEFCKQHIPSGQWYWGRFHCRWCLKCADGVATEPPPNTQEPA